MTIGSNIKKFRIQKGLTQQELAKLIGVDHSNISQIENDDRGLNVKKADKIASALGVTLNDLMKGE